jgi:hypothetical protein
MRHTCKYCRRKFDARSDAIFCSPTCKARNHDAPRNAQNRKTTTPVSEHPFVLATRRELEAAGRLDSLLGVAAVNLAEAMCAPRKRNSEMVALSREFSRTVKAALKGAPVGKLAVVRPVDELTTRRTKRQKRGYAGRSD